MNVVECAGKKSKEVAARELGVAPKSIRLECGRVKLSQSRVRFLFPLI